jgi:hypothetical protein
VTDKDNVSGIRSADGSGQESFEAAPLHLAAIRAREEGRYDDALRHVQAAFARALAEKSDPRVSMFMPMLEWQFLLECHPPARAALVQARDAQVQHLLAGEFSYGVAYSAYSPRRSRFCLIVEMNELLGDAPSTHAVFLQLEAMQPERARREAFIALPAIVEAGDYALGERYMADPMGFLAHLNEEARIYTMFPPGREAPRLAANLSNFAKDLRLRAAIVRGLGREDEAQALLDAALAGLANDELRDWTRRDLAEPGTIIRAMSEHRMALDEGRPSPYLEDDE